MARIKSDLEGVVHVYQDGVLLPQPLAAGDEVPEGVEVGDHLLEPEEKPAAKSTKRPARGAAKTAGDDA